MSLSAADVSGESTDGPRIIDKASTPTESPDWSVQAYPETTSCSSKYKQVEKEIKN